MNAVVSEILNLEKIYNHDELFKGSQSEEDALDKLGLIMNTLSHISGSEDMELENASVTAISGLVNAHALSPECAAYILFLAYPDDGYKYKRLSQLYRNRAVEDYAVFQAVYFAKKYEETNNKLRLFDKYTLINEKYIKRYKDQKTKYFGGRGAVYTVITGTYDDLVDPAVINPDWDYYCFTDDETRFRSDVWKIRRLDHIIEGDNTRTQRYAKTHPYLLLPDYDYTVYIDGSLTIIGDMTEYINVFSRGSSMLCFPHPLRQKLEDEVYAIKTLRMHVEASEHPEFDEQIQCYRQEGYKDNLPLVETGCLIRSNRDPLLNSVMETWWNEILNRTHRDQLSFGYACWKHDYIYDISALEVCNGKYLSLRDHK